MSEFKRRDRIVLFRVTEDEYTEIKKATERQGARTVSDFARTQLMDVIARKPPDVGDKLNEIQSSVRRIEKLITGVATGNITE